MARWWWRADYFESCNCAHGCPCNLTMLPTHGTCEAIDGWKIREGAYEDVRLDGLGLGLLLSWPNPIHRGNGRCIVFVDERADARQREALAKIGSGQAGEGGPFPVFAGTYAEPPRVVHGAFEMEPSARGLRVRLGDLAQLEIGPIKSDMDGSDANARLMLPTGFIFRDARIMNTERCAVKAPGLAFELRDSSAFLSDVAYNV